MKVHLEAQQAYVLAMTECAKCEIEGCTTICPCCSADTIEALGNLQKQAMDDYNDAYRTWKMLGCANDGGIRPPKEIS